MSTDPDEEAARADLELVRRVLAGDRTARAEFAQRMKCVPRILAMINGRRGARLTAHDIEDLTQDTMVRILEKLGTFRGHTTLEYWADRFCYLETMNRIRSRGRESAVVSAGLEGDVEQNEPEARILDSGELEEWLERMDPDRSDVVRLKLFEDLEFHEIGDALGIPRATAKSRYYRGIAWLQHNLAALQENRR